MNSTSILIPEDASLETLSRSAAGCRACELWKRGTQTVFGEGPTEAPLFLVGEQPGDAEDLTGKPFVGPAGKLLDRALHEAGIERTETYITNAVKHFKWQARGKRRIHQKPDSRQIAACSPWLSSELALVRPKVLVCLGPTAAQALLGRQFRVSKQRGEIIQSQLAPYVMATVHPSSILRVEDDDARQFEFEEFVADLAKVIPLLSA